jgi:PAT family beta-lactamase induction signal transducer AmpG
MASGEPTLADANGAFRFAGTRYKDGMSDHATTAPAGWRDRLPAGVRPYTEAAPIAAFFLGISSGFPYAMIGATLTTRLAQDDITKSTVTAFALAFLVYNLKFLWAWIVDGVRIPILGRLGQRVSWLILSGVLVMAAVANLAFQDPSASIYQTAVAAILVGVAGATFDIVIDGYRIELLEPRQLGVGSGMSQYGWRIGSVAAGALALVLAARVGWEAAYLACAAFALPAMITGLVMGEPPRHRDVSERKGIAELWASIAGPFAEFFMRKGALLVLLFILLHKIGDTLANLVLRLLLDDMGYTNDEIAIYDVGIGFWAYLIGIFVGGILYAQIGMKRSVLIALILMGVSNLSFAALAAAGHSNLGLAGTIGFENFASGIGGVVVVAYFSALTDLRFTATQYALISAAASVVGRVLTGTTAGALVESFGYVNFYLLTTLAALPGVLLFWWMMRAGLIDASIGTAGKEGEGDARAAEQPAG